MKIVLEYYVGSDWEGTHHTECFEADSCEEIYCFLDEKVTECLSKTDIRTSNELMYAEHFKFKTSFNICPFIRHDKFKPPNIYELNEWFQLKIEGAI